VARDNGRSGGGVTGRDGKIASFCKVAAVSVKPEKENVIMHYSKQTNQHVNKSHNNSYKCVESNEKCINSL